MKRDSRSRPDGLRGRASTAAAVTTPSVPALPMKSCWRSYPRIVFVEHIEAVPDAPVAEHDLEAWVTRSRVSAVAQHVDLAGVTRCRRCATLPCAPLGYREQAVLFLHAFLAFSRMQSGFAIIAKPDWIDHAHFGVEPVEADNELSSARAATAAPTRPVRPP